jgi:hypothetical protein
VLTTAGTGIINANELGGVLLSGLATGPLCNTTTTGVPSACTLASFTALGLAPLASPAFTGTPTAPTAAVGTSTTQVASTAFVAAALPSGQQTFSPSGTYTFTTSAHTTTVLVCARGGSGGGGGGGGGGALATVGTTGGNGSSGIAGVDGMMTVSPQN